MFATHHFRRKLVSGSYISMDPNDNKSNEESVNELDSDDNSTYSDNIVNMETTADNEFSAEE